MDCEAVVLPYRTSLFMNNCFFVYFLFTRKSHPELKEQLGELRRHLLESGNDMAPLKVWEMQGLNVSFSVVE